MPKPRCTAECAQDFRRLEGEKTALILAAVKAKSESGWLIELGESEVSRPDYWIGPGATPEEWPFGLWSSDHMKAIRFARREDAEAVAEKIQMFANDPRAQFRVCEHGWG